MARQEITILETANFKTIARVCNDAMLNSKFIGVIGYPGAGKTIALNEYTSLNPNVFYVCVEPSMTSKKLFQKVLKVLGDTSNNADLSLNYMINKASMILNEDNENKLVIFDEAGLLTQKTLIYLREFRDKTINYTGIVIAGCDYLMDNIKKLSAKGAIGIPEIESRIYYWQILDKPTKNEFKAICSVNKIKDNETVNKWIKEHKNFRKLFNAIAQYKYEQEDSQK